MKYCNHVSCFRHRRQAPQLTEMKNDDLLKLVTLDFHAASQA